MAILWLIGVKILLSIIELVFCCVMGGSASRKKRYIMYILFLFASFAELKILAGWLRILFPVIYGLKEVIPFVMLWGIEILVFAAIMILRCRFWIVFWEKPSTRESSSEQEPDLD
ncbi:MAG: hypothetical protein HFH97_01390 [Lachnospiraceae bacterium]|jgi:hypothetical protein|nr:hypothetical protein [uncultured Acetatifactor sp.]MCI9571256.1 hypothetical protein [Lachnospiraceae bacterium]